MSDNDLPGGDEPDLTGLPDLSGLPDLHGLLEGSSMAEGGEDALRSIVARHGRRRRRALTIALVVVAVAGPTAGYLIGTSNGSSRSGTVLSAGATPSVPGGPTHLQAGGTYTMQGSVSGNSVGPNEPAQTQLFLRTTGDGIRIRAYEQALPQPSTSTSVRAGATPSAGASTTTNPNAPRTSVPGAGPNGVTCAVTAVPAIVGAPAAAPPITSPPTTGAVSRGGCQPVPAVVCLPSGLLTAEVSNDQVAGVAEGPYVSNSTQTLNVLSAQVVGAGEPTPIGTVLVQAGPKVSMVRLSLAAGGTDEMAPVHGFGILALAVSSSGSNQGAQQSFPAGTVEALGAAGQVLASVTLPGTGGTQVGPGCTPAPITVPAPLETTTGPSETTTTTTPASPIGGAAPSSTIIDPDTSEPTTTVAP